MKFLALLALLSGCVSFDQPDVLSSSTSACAGEWSVRLASGASERVVVWVENGEPEATHKDAPWFTIKLEHQAHTLFDWGSSACHLHAVFNDDRSIVWDLWVTTNTTDTLSGTVGQDTVVDGVFDRL